MRTIYPVSYLMCPYYQLKSYTTLIHTSMNFYVQNLNFRGWETNITLNPPPLYIYVCKNVYVYITYKYMLQRSHFLCQNSKYTHLFKFLYLRVWYQPTLVSTSKRKPYLPAHKPQRSMEWPILKWKQITLQREIILKSQ